MTEQEIFNRIRRNGIEKSKAIILIADFLVKSKQEAREIYENEFER